MSPFSDVCYHATSKTLQSLVDASYAVCVVTVTPLFAAAAVRPLRFSACADHVPPLTRCDQMTFYFLCASVACVMLYRWRRMGQPRRNRNWPLYVTCACYVMKTSVTCGALQIRMDDRADLLRQCLRHFDVGCMDGLPREGIHRLAFARCQPPG